MLNLIMGVLPKTEDGNLVSPFYDMSGWSAPVHKKYKIVFKNLYGVEVISFTYGVTSNMVENTMILVVYLRGKYLSR